MLTHNWRQDDLLSLPRDHVYSLHGPFLVTTQHAVDVGLVGWNEKRWKLAATDATPKKAAGQQDVTSGSPLQQETSEFALDTSHATFDAPAAGQWWRAYDPSSGALYYYNQQVNISQWDPPDLAFKDDATVQYWISAAESYPAQLEAAVFPSCADACQDTLSHKHASETVAETPDRGNNSWHPDEDATCRPSAAKDLFSPRRKGDLQPDVEKYWIARYSLFSRWSEGVCLNEKSLFSVTPEVIAKHHAQMLRGNDVIVDAFCGCGGNAVQLAMSCRQVIACDNDAEQLSMARQNASLYGVADRIDFRHCDFFREAPMIEADAVFLSPPWGGPEYLSHSSFQPQFTIPGFDSERLIDDMCCGQ